MIDRDFEAASEAVVFAARWYPRHWGEFAELHDALDNAMLHMGIPKDFLNGTPIVHRASGLMQDARVFGKRRPL